VTWTEITRSDFDNASFGKVESSKGEEEGELAFVAHSSHVASEAESNQWERSHCRYFKAVFAKEKVQLQALVEISPEYPVRPPVFKLNLPRKIDAEVYPPEFIAKSDPEALKIARSSPCFDNNLKNMEVEVNANYSVFTRGQLTSHWLLSYQIQRLRMCFDIYVDTTTQAQQLKHETGIRPFRGRARSFQFNQF